MSSPKHRWAVVATAAAVCVVTCSACERSLKSIDDAPPAAAIAAVNAAELRVPPVATPSPVVRVASRDAAHQMAVARCSRETACGKIRGKFGYTAAHTDACVRAFAKRMESDFAVAACGPGIDRDALDECLDDMGATDCAKVGDPHIATHACAATALCATSTETN